MASFTLSSCFHAFGQVDHADHAEEGVSIGRNKHVEKVCWEKVGYVMETKER